MESRSETRTVNEEENENNNERIKYEVVLYAAYNNESYPRPSEEDIEKFFNKYGKVDHIVCPEDKNCAFIFMESLNTDAEFKRTRTVINEIIKNMTTEENFYITVARSKRSNYHRRGEYQRSQNPRYRYPNDRYPNWRYDGNRRPIDLVPREYMPAGPGNLAVQPVYDRRCERCNCEGFAVGRFYRRSS